jgi:Flp pilus assembly protein TadG
LYGAGAEHEVKAGALLKKPLTGPAFGRANLRFLYHDQRSGLLNAPLTLPAKATAFSPLLPDNPARMSGLSFMSGKFHAAARRLCDFARARRGNVAVIFALSLIPMALAAGAGLDYARAVVARSSMAAALDAAALAVGKAKSKPDTCTANSSDSGCTALKAIATQYFLANYVYADPGNQTTAAGGTAPGLTMTIANQSVQLSVNDKVPTQMVKWVLTNIPISTATTVVWGQTKLWVALVLDNSGSMCQPDDQPCKNDTNSKSKIYQLKSATKTMLTNLQGVSTTAGDVQVAIVPFNREVSMSNPNVSTSSIDWSFWEAVPKANNTTTITDSYGVDENSIDSTVSAGSKAPSTIAFAAWGPGDDCPFTYYKSNKNYIAKPFGFYCMDSPGNDVVSFTSDSTSDTARTIPSSGSTKGYICPSLDSGNYNTERNDRWYNGCWTSTKDGSNKVVVDKGTGATCNGFSASNCTCIGSGSNKSCSTQKWTHLWVPNAHSTWGGCVTDRVQDLDIQNGSVSSSFPADNPYSSPVVPVSTSQCMNGIVTPLESDFSDLASKVDLMQAGGSTNQAIGVAHGWQTLTPGAPYGAGSVPANTTRYIILLSDGLNTQDRWYGDGGTEGTSDDGKIDDRMSAVCSAAKNDGVVIYTLYVHVNGGGDSGPLQDCASGTDKYYDLTSSDQIAAAFADITQKITNLRVAK